MVQVFSAKLRGHCSTGHFCFFSAAEAFCEKCGQFTFPHQRFCIFPYYIQTHKKVQLKFSMSSNLSRQLQKKEKTAGSRLFFSLLEFTSLINFIAVEN